MKTALGIDTGGTYTDAVLYDLDGGIVLASAKSLTTKEDFSVGIAASLGELDAARLREVSMVCLSTTLATNACIEDRGGRAKLVIVGGDERIVGRYGSEYGLPPVEEILFLDGEISSTGEILAEPDWERFARRISTVTGSYDAFAVAGMWATRNPYMEEKVRDIIGRFDRRTICSYELSNDLNYLIRGSTALLNARLIPIIPRFLSAIRKALAEHFVTAPVFVVRSDGSLMSETFAAERPIETLLCGPTASVKGAVALADEVDAVIIDMGGTTTDVSIVEAGLPVRTTGGVNVGGWKIGMDSIFIDTFGLGGDSRVRIDRNLRLLVGPKRVVPLCSAASVWDSIVPELERLRHAEFQGVIRVYEFFHLVKDIGEDDSWTEGERALCRALAEKPLTVEQSARVMGKDIYSAVFDRLEAEGIIMRIGFTPTDVMHIRGDFARFEKQASVLAAGYFTKYLGISIDELCRMVYDSVGLALYTGTVNVLLSHAGLPSPNGSGEALRALIHDGYYKADVDAPFFGAPFTTRAALVGVGAPIHVFLPDVARRLRARCVIPEHAAVANAVGAVVSDVSVTREILIKPEYTVSGITGYHVLGYGEVRFVPGYAEAVAIATHAAEKAAEDEARLRGMDGEIIVTSRVVKHECAAAPGVAGPVVVDLGGKVSATAVARSPAASL